MTGRAVRTAVRCAVIAGVALGSAGCGGRDAHQDQAVESITVAAASDLRPAFEELAGRFTEETGIEITFSFGSSGLLREQVLDGAPFDLFASADDDDVDQVIDAGRADPTTRSEYARGRLVIWTTEGTSPPEAIGDLTDPRFGTVAIANPEHAPYGRAALEALASAGVDDELGDRLVFGENVVDALRIVESGNAGAGIVARSLVVRDGDRAVLVPERLHEPLRQTLVVTGSGPRADAAARFATTVSSDAGQEIMARYGFEPAGTEGGS